MSPEPERPIMAQQAFTHLALGCHALHALLRDPDTGPPRRSLLRAAHTTIAAMVVGLFPSETATEAMRQAVNARRVLAREPTDDEVSDVYEMVLHILIPLAGE